ncbi:MAG TPA: ribonuclease III [Azospirillaceae bacterium]|nr:ribonuclease III [Azospirillaceae bacterium]
MAAPEGADGADADLAGLAAALGHGFDRPELLAEAMTHPSLTDRGAAGHGYERLEFLGDRVLGLVVAEWLLERFPDEPEGSLAKRHTAMVQADALAAVAEAIGLGRYLRLSAGEQGGGGRAKRAILADACEAAIGALFLDGGLEAARRFIRAGWAAQIEAATAPPQDPKTALQEWALARSLPLPAYETLSRTGPDHSPVFEVRVSVKGHPPQTASGTSKRAAEKSAAALLLDCIAAKAAG